MLDLLTRIALRRPSARGRWRGRDASSCLGIRAGGEPDVVGVLSQARPHLLSVDHPLVAVAHGGRLQRGEVGAGGRARSSRWRRRSRRPGSWGRNTGSVPRVPYSRRVGPTVLRVRKGSGKPTAWTSSAKMNCSTGRTFLAPVLFRPGSAPAARPCPSASLPCETPGHPPPPPRPRRARLVSSLGHHVDEVPTQLVSGRLPLLRREIQFHENPSAGCLGSPRI